MCRYRGTSLTRNSPPAGPCRVTSLIITGIDKEKAFWSNFSCTFKNARPIVFRERPSSEERATDRFSRTFLKSRTCHRPFSEFQNPRIYERGARARTPVTLSKLIFATCMADDEMKGGHRQLRGFRVQGYFTHQKTSLYPPRTLP